MASSDEKRELVKIVCDGFSSLVFAFGYKTGIVKSFIEIEQPCTAEELSEKSGKKLRYIQEWLGCMVATGIVTITDDEKYSLPYNDNEIEMFGHISTAIPILSEIFPKLDKVAAIHGPNGFGFNEPYKHWCNTPCSPEFLQEWKEDFLVPVMNLKPGNAFMILDIGCGFGQMSREVAKLYPHSKVYAIDMDQVSIDNAREELTKDGPKNIEFICMRGGQLPEEWEEKFDFVIIADVLHDSFEVDAILEEIKRVLNPDGFVVASDPAVSSFHKNLINDTEAQLRLAMSFFTCLPASYMNSEEGLGVGWGYERRKEKIEKHGFRVVQVGDKDIETIQERIVFQKM